MTQNLFREDLNVDLRRRRSASLIVTGSEDGRVYTARRVHIVASRSSASVNTRAQAKCASVVVDKFAILATRRQRGTYRARCRLDRNIVSLRIQTSPEEVLLAPMRIVWPPLDARSIGFDEGGWPSGH